MHVQMGRATHTNTPGSATCRRPDINAGRSNVGPILGWRYQHQSNTGPTRTTIQAGDFNPQMCAILNAQLLTYFPIVGSPKLKTVTLIHSYA